MQVGILPPSGHRMSSQPATFLREWNSRWMLPDSGQLVNGSWIKGRMAQLGSLGIPPCCSLQSARIGQVQA